MLARFEDFASRNVQNTRLSTLKNLRLCNKKLACLSAEFLFEEVLLHFTSESHAKLELISHHPVYKTYVRGLHIVPKVISGALVPRNQFGFWINSYTILLQHRHSTYIIDEHWDRGMFTAPSSRKAIKIHYEDYSYLHAKQQKLLGTAEGVLQAAVGCLPHLKRVKSGLYWDWNSGLYWEFKRRMQNILPNGEPLSGWDRARRRLELSPYDDLINGLWKGLACRAKFDMDQGAIVLRAVARGKAVSGARVDVGHLLRDLETADMQTIRADDKAVIQSLMADIEHFCFYSNLNDLAHGPRGDMPPHSLSRFLQAMEKVACPPFPPEHLSTDPSTNILGNNVVWNRLNQLSIKGIHGLDLRCLAELTHRHKDSLRHLSLYDVVYHAGDWADRCDVWADLRAGTLEEIQIWSVERVQTEALTWETSKRGLPPMELRREAYECADSGSHDKIVFRGEAWEPKLGESLRKELVAPLFSSFAHAQPGLLAEEDQSGEGAGSETSM